LQFGFGLPPKCPPRPPSNWITARAIGGFWLASVSEFHPPEDCPITTTPAFCTNDRVVM
jgi:hypothetical protein